MKTSFLLILTAFLALSAGLSSSTYESPAYRVVARRRPEQPSETRLSAAEARRLAGTSGDVVRAVAALPGAVTPNDFLANLMVRGGGMEDNLYLFDGFPVSYPFHFGGVESVFHPGLIGAADFLPSGFDARFGDAQGGVLELRPRKAPQGLHGEASISMILAGALLSYGGEAAAGAAGYRRGFFDLVLDSHSSLTGIPRYQDYAARVEAGEFALTAFGSEDELKVYSDPDAVKNNPSLAGEAGWQSSFHTAGLSWDHRFDGGFFAARASGSLSRAAVDLGADLSLDRRPYEWLASFEAGLAPADSPHEADFGAQWRQTRTMLSGTFKRLPVELGSGFDFNSLQTVTVDALGSKGVLSIWAQDRWQVLEQVWLSGGARFDRVDFSDEFHFSPRASAQWKILEKTTLRAWLGDYFQSPNGLETVPGWISGFSKSSLTRGFGAAVEQGLGGHLELRAEAWKKDFSRAIPPFTVSATGVGSVELNAASTGWAEGAEAMLRFKPTPLFFGWLSYAWSNTLRSAGQGYYEGDFSQPHVVNLAFNLSPFSGFEFGSRYRLASGIPYTPIASRSFDVPQNRWIPVFGATNSQRLDWYQRLDLRAQYEWRFESWLFRPFLEVYNLLDRPNVTSVTYEDDYSGIRIIKQFPRFLFVGLEAEF